MNYYIGIDVGSSSTKLLLLNEDGEAVKQCSHGYTGSQPVPDWQEIEPEIWFDAVESELPFLLQSIDARTVKAIGITGQLHTTVFLDRNGNSIRPAMLWNDTRTKGDVAELKEKIRSFPAISSIADILSTGSPAADLYWLKKNEPENFSRLYTFLIGPNYVAYRLTGHPGTDFSEASTSSLYDIEQRRWSPEMRQIIGLSETVYPNIYDSTSVIGTVRPELAQKYGFSLETQVIVGMGDNPASAISTGCLAQGYPVLSLGTSGVLMVPKTVGSHAKHGKNILLSLGKDHFITLIQGVVQSAGNDMTWWLCNILKSDQFSVETYQVASERLGEGNLLFYPHLMGEKTIYSDPNQRGAFLGLSTETTRTDMTQAINEGICFAVKELAETMDISSEQLYGLRVTGGGAQNSLWMQMMADVLNVEIDQLDGNIGAAYGIALLAMCAGTAPGQLDTIVKQTAFVKRKFYPRAYNAGLYEIKYRKYKKIHDALVQVYEP